MSDVLHEWALTWGIPYAALEDLRARTGVVGHVAAPAESGKSEAWVSSVIRLEAARLGHYLWRNNCGAGYMQDGSFLRFGLANDSSAVNKVFKSSDFIGLRKRRIEQRDVGTILGQFLAREMKKPGWVYTGRDEEPAQLKFIQLVQAAGGDARFATGEGTL
jgi:hypothetical protein